jgi:tetratricopeptide (TPR) repeat protein
VRWQAALLALAVGCADWRRPPLTAPYRADEPLVQEQALLGISRDGSAAAAQLVDAEGAPPRLELIALEAQGGPTRHLAAAPDEAARAVSRRLRAEGRKRVPLLAAAIADFWPDALAIAAREGFPKSGDAILDSAGGESSKVSRHSVPARVTGSSPLLLRVALSRGDPPAFLLLLGMASEPDGRVEEVELARQPISGAPIEGGLWWTADIVWLLSGSVDGGEPLRRAVGLRRGSLRRGEADLHNRRGLSLRAARDLQRASREFELAIATDPAYVEPLYNAASTAAASGRDEDAVELLRRAAAVDRRRVQVLGRSDESLQALRRRADVREILGMKRPPP